MTWAEGYPTEIDYSTGYYPDLSPGMLRFACLTAGVVLPPQDECAYLELGFGRGLAISIHAASNAGQFWGNDFNPNHVAYARALAQAADPGIQQQFLDDSFEELLRRRDLPQFDCIILHGIWSWISEKNRNAIVEILRKKLKVGGIVYISYNCYPGWAPAQPVRNLVSLYAHNTVSGGSGAGDRVDEALDAVRHLAQADVAYFRTHENSARFLNGLATQDKNYVAHEYTCQDWHLMDFSEVSQTLKSAKLEFLTSARFLDTVNSLNLSPSAEAIVNAIADPAVREVTKDFCVDRQFRTDIFVKGARRLSRYEAQAALGAQAFALLAHPDDIPMTVRGTRAQANLDSRIYEPLIAAFQKYECAPKTVKELVDMSDGLSTEDVAQAVTVLTGIGHLTPAFDPTADALRRCTALNTYLYLRANGGAPTSFLASPVAGRGIAASRVEQTYLAAIAQGLRTPHELATFAWKTLERQGQRLLRDGGTLESADENIDELTRQASNFTDKRLPILHSLKVSIATT